MAFSAEDILGEFAEAQHYGQRFRSDEEHDRVYHADRRRAMAPVYEARARTRAKANLKAWLGADYRAPAVPMRTRA